MGCFSGRLMSTASDQKLFCKLCSPFCCSFDEFVEEKVISPSYSSAILTPSLVSLIFFKRSCLSHSIIYSIFCPNHWGRLSYLSLPFFGTLHSNGCIFPFLHCFSLLFFSQLFVRPPQSAALLFCISFSWGRSWSLSPLQCHELLSIFLQALYQI